MSKDNLNNSGNYHVQAEVAAEKALFLRNKFLVGLSVGAVIIGLIFPAYAGLLDIGWGISLSVTAVLVFLCLAGKTIKDLKSLPAIIAGAIFLRFALLINATKFLFEKSEPGILSKVSASVLIINSGHVFLVIAVMAFAAIWASLYFAKKFKGKCSSFTVEILPLKKSVIESRNNIGVINTQDVDVLNEQLKLDGNFYLSMLSISKILSAEAIASFVILLIIAASSAALSVLEESFARFYLVKASSVAVLYLSQLVVSAIFIWLLIDRMFVESSQLNNVVDSHFEPEQVKKIVGQKDSDVLNPDFVDKKSSSDTTLPVSDHIDIKEAEFEMEKQTFENLRKWSPKHYDKIASALVKLPGKVSKVVLLGSDSFLNLPVNIPVNIAIRLAQENRKCLLVDLDVGRNAIQRVFEDSFSGSKDGSIVSAKTCIQNVYFLKGDVLSCKNVNEQMGGHLNDFEHIIIYAPNLDDSSGQLVFKDSIRSAILFGDKKDSSSMDSIRQDLKGYGAKIINIKN